MLQWVTDLAAWLRDVRFTPESEHQGRGRGGLRIHGRIGSRDAAAPLNILDELLGLL